MNGNVGIGTDRPSEALTLGAGNNLGINLNAPTSLSFNTGAGSLGAGTYYYKVTALDAAGGETTSSSENSQAVGAGSSITVNWAAVSGASSYRIYRGTSSNGQNTYYSSTTNSYVDTGSAGTAGTVPAVNLAFANKFLGTGAASIQGTLTVPAITSPGSSALTLNGGSSTGNVEIAGGSASTGCTVTNSNGNLDCSGTITSNGAVIANYWQRNAGAIAPINTADDFLLGGSATASAKFGVLNMTGSGTPTATISGNLTLNSAGVIATTKMQDLSIGDANTGLVKIGNPNALANNIGYQYGATVSGTLHFDSVYGVDGAGLTNCTGSTQRLIWNSTTKRFACTNIANTIKTFTDTTSTTTVATAGTDYWNGSHANITPSAATNSVLVQISVLFSQTSGGSGNQYSFDIAYSTDGTDVVCTDSKLTASSITVVSGANGNHPVTTVNIVHAANSTSATSYTVCSATPSSTTGTVLRRDITLTEVTTSDLAEVYPTTEQSLLSGDILTSDSSMTNGVKKSTSANDSTLMGVVSTKPAQIIGGADLAAGSSAAVVALTGRVPVKITSLNGSVSVGDPITSSNLPGIGMRQTQPGTIVGRIIETPNVWDENTCLPADSVEEASNSFPYDDTGANSQSPCFAIPTQNVSNVPDTYTKSHVYLGKVMIKADKGFNIPDLLTNPESGLQISELSADQFSLIDSSNNVITNSQSFSNIKSANGTFGQLTTANIAASQIDLGEYNITADTATSSALIITNAVDQHLLELSSNGNLTVSGSLTTSGSAITQDYSSSDTTFEEGDVVAIDDVTVGSVKKSKTSYDQDIVGIYSTGTGISLSSPFQNSAANHVPVALSGNVPVKINTENGAIKKGDYLTSSSTPGYAMKATHSGQVIGKALEDFSCDKTEVVSPETPVCSGKILTFINISYANPNNSSSDATSSISTANINLASDLTIGNQNINGSLDLALTAISQNLTSVDNRLATVESAQASVSAEIAQVSTTIEANSDILSGLTQKVEDLFDNLSSTNDSIASAAATIAKLTSPDTLISTDSAVIADINYLSTSTIPEISRIGAISFGDTSINVDGTLRIQNGPLASSIELFGGAIVIEKNGDIKTLGNLAIGGNLNLEGALTTSATAGEDIKAKDVLYVSESGIVKKADSTTPDKLAVVGIAAADASVGQPVVVITGGKTNGFAGLEVGRRYYLGANAQLTTAAPPESLETLSLGIAFSETELIMQITPTLLLDTSTILPTDSTQSATPAPISDTSVSSGY
jgi:hypothetical protein